MTMVVGQIETAILAAAEEDGGQLDKLLQELSKAVNDEERFEHILRRVCQTMSEQLRESSGWKDSGRRKPCRVE